MHYNLLHTYSSYLMKNAWLLFIFSMASSVCIAQTTTTPIERTTPRPKKAERGTYQFIAEPEDSASVFTDDILVVIESLRDEKKIVYFDASPTVKVKILPRSDINQNGYKPLQEWLVKKDE